MLVQSDCELHDYTLASLSGPSGKKEKGWEETGRKEKGWEEMGRKETGKKVKRRKEDSNFEVIPIIYNPNYDVKFFKIERLHPFDTRKWGRISHHIRSYLEERGRRVRFLSPKREISEEELAVVHSKDFIERIHKWKREIAAAAEVWPILLLPLSLIHTHLLTPLKWQVSGSVLAGKVALDRGWAINLGGGFHHCSNDQAGGFCLFADITLLMQFLWNEVNQDLNILIVDLDAHQGNGYARDVMSLRRRSGSTSSVDIDGKQRSDRVYIFDMYNSRIYPRDVVAKEAINRAVELKCHTQDKEYLALLSFHLLASLDDFKPHLVLYNAGTDVLLGDPLGKLDISPQGVIERDRLVFTEIRARNIPIGMTVEPDCADFPFLVCISR